MPKRRFELKEGSSAKFWEIELKGKSYQVTFGKIGTDGQTRKKQFDSKQAATEAADRLIKQKIKKGYHETSQDRRGGKKTNHQRRGCIPARIQFRTAAKLRELRQAVWRRSDSTVLPDLCPWKGDGERPTTTSL